MSPSTGIVLSESLVGKRRLFVETAFRPIIGSKRVNVFSGNSGTLKYFGLGSQTAPCQLRYARHPTDIARLFVNYFEVWNVIDRKKFTLQKAYMHIDRASEDGRSDNEILALHADPKLFTDPAMEYRKGLHLHISGNAIDIRKAHISLSLLQPDAVCTDIDCFNSIFKGTLKMIRHVLFPHWST